MKVTAVAHRSEGWWAVEVPEVRGVFTQVRRLDQVASQAADAVAALMDLDAGDVIVTVEPKLDGDAQAAVDVARAKSADAAQAQAEASEATRSAVSCLQDTEALTVRDTARLLGLTHQRVSQLAHSR